MWVYDDNLLPFLTTLGWIVSYAFDHDDWTAISSGIQETDQEADRWYRYEFAGSSRVEFSLARDPGSSVIFVRAVMPPDQEAQLELAIKIFARFRLKA